MDDTPSIEQFLSFFALERLPLALLIFVAGWAALQVVGRVLDDLGERFADRRLTFKKVGALLRFGVYGVLAVMVPLSMLDTGGRQAIVPLLATLGLGLGFAFRDLIASLIAGVLLLVDEPFQVGDRVSFGGYYGEVTEIGLRSVRLVTLDDNLVTIPNSKFLTDAVASANAGALDCMVVVPFYLSMDADAERGRRVIAEVAATSRFVYLDKSITTVVADEVVADGVATVLRVKAYVFDARYEKAFSTDLTVRGKRALQHAGVKHAEVITGAARAAR